MKRTRQGALGILLAVAACSWDGPQAAFSGESTANGKHLYKQNCLVCHGPKGKGDGYRRLNPPPADLSSSSVLGKTDVQLMKTIHEGRPNTAMGAWKWALSEQESKDVLAYVRTFGR